jgi:AcrR family transcriptional regulator
MDHQADPRATRTRDAILGAFSTLALNRRYDAIRTADLIAAAGVGRSTFYEHFRGKDEVLVAAIEPILHTLASAALGRASNAQVRAMLDHVWEQRAVARMLLEGRTGAKLQRRLAALIMARLEARGEVVIATRGVAAAQLTMLHLWLSGAVSCPAHALVEHLLAFRPLLKPPPCSCESRSPG